MLIDIYNDKNEKVIVEEVKVKQAKNEIQQEKNDLKAYKKMLQWVKKNTNDNPEYYCWNWA